jgi:hypothetical protein
LADSLLYIALVAVFVEVLAYFLVPRAFAVLARLPVGLKRRVEISVPRLEQLTAHLATNDKGRVRRELDLGRIEWPASIKTDALVGKAARNGAWVRVRQVSWLPQGWAVAKVVARQRKDDIVLKARFVPVPFGSPLLLLASLAWYVASHEAAVGAAFAAGLVLGVWGALTLAVRAQLHQLLVPIQATLEAAVSGQRGAGTGPR